MTRTKRQLAASLKLVDCVAEIIDARIPFSSRNPDLRKLINNKPRIVLMNKCDIADKTQNQKWIAVYKNAGITALPVDCKTGKGLNAFMPAVRTVLADKIKAWEAKGMKGKTIKVMVVGIPNVGKSSFINKMVKQSKAKVEDRPGVTRGNQWFTIGKGFELLDTPGVLWPKFEDKLVGERLAFTGAVKDDIMDMEYLACRLLEFLKENYPELIEKRYGIRTDDIEPADEETIGCVVGFELLERIGRKRGFLVSGGEINTERAAITVMDEFRNGTLGRLTLEKPKGY